MSPATSVLKPLISVPLLIFDSLPLVLQNSVGLSNRLSRLLAACNAISYLVFSFAGLHLIERAGRRKLLMWGAAGQAVCYIFIFSLAFPGRDELRCCRDRLLLRVLYFLRDLLAGE